MIVPALLVALQVGDFGLYEMSGLTPERKLAVRVPMKKLDPPKHSPLQRWVFEWTVTGMWLESENYTPRIRVFSQSRTSPYEQDVSVGVARQLIRQWDFNRSWLKLEHSPEYVLSCVDVYLSFGGRPGGEHRFDIDPDDKTRGGSPAKVNTMYVYQAQEISSALEWCRELAHEYGHATLPPVFLERGREQWANGDLGERLYLRWFRDLLASGALTTSDTMGATKEQLDAYVIKHVDPLAKRVFVDGPGLRALAKEDDVAFESYLALACYAREVLPLAAFARSLVLAGDQTPRSYADAVIEAASEPKTWSPEIRASLIGKPVWLPLGKGRLIGARVLSRSGGWARVSAKPGMKIAND